MYWVDESGERIFQTMTDKDTLVLYDGATDSLDELIVLLNEKDRQIFELLNGPPKLEPLPHQDTPSESEREYTFQARTKVIYEYLRLFLSEEEVLDILGDSSTLEELEEMLGKCKITRRKLTVMEQVYLGLAKTMSRVNLDKPSGVIFTANRNEEEDV